MTAICDFRPFAHFNAHWTSDVYRVFVFIANYNLYISTTEQKHTARHSRKIGRMASIHIICFVCRFIVFYYFFSDYYSSLLYILMLCIWHISTLYIYTHTHTFLSTVNVCTVDIESYERVDIQFVSVCLSLYHHHHRNVSEWWWWWKYRFCLLCLMTLFEIHNF